MAKSQSSKRNHTHIPTKIGFGIIAIVVLVFGLVLATQYNFSEQTQTLQTVSTKPTPALTWQFSQNVK